MADILFSGIDWILVMHTLTRLAVQTEEVSGEARTLIGTQGVNTAMFTTMIRLNTFIDICKIKVAGMKSA